MWKVMYFEGFFLCMKFLKRKIYWNGGHLEVICFAYMKATVVGGSVAEEDQPAMVLFSN